MIMKKIKKAYGTKTYVLKQKLKLEVYQHCSEATELEIHKSTRKK